MIQDDPYAAFSRPVQNDPYAGIATAAPARPAPQRQAPRPAQPRPAPQSVAPQAPTDETGLTAQEQMDALMAQGYSREEALGFVDDPGTFPAQPAAPYTAAQGSDLDPAAALARYQAAYPNDTGARVIQHGEPGYPGSESRFDPSSGTYVALSPTELAAKQAAEARVGQGAETGIADRIRALSSGLSLGLSDELERALVEAQGRGENLNRRLLGEELPYTSQQLGEAFSRAASERADRFASDRPLQNFALQFAGGLAAPGVAQSGRFISQGVTGADRTRRAAGVGSGIGAVAGGATAEGDFGDRAVGAGLGALVGAGTGAVGQRMVDRAAFPQAVEGSSPSRQLSREGVNLTLGQMLEPTPLVGGTIRATEDRLAGLPFIGDVVQGARGRSLESANVAALNRTLEPIGETMPRNIGAGYDGVDYAQTQLGRAYDDVLSRTSLQLDQPLYDDIGRVVAEAPATMGEARTAQLAEILASRVFRNAPESNSVIPGDEFKRIESALGQQRRDLVRSQDSDQQALGRALGDIQGVFRDALARQNPAEASRLSDINRGYANLVRVEDAAGATGNAARGGVFTAAQLGSAVRRMTPSRSMRGRGEGQMADLAQNMAQVLPSTVPDSGTAGRGMLAALVAGGGALVKPEIAIPVLAGAAPYTRAGQALINRIYRATDPAEARPALAELERLAQRHPELQEVYQDAARRVLPDAQSPTQENQRAQR
jgi:hypothetical protein